MVLIIYPMNSADLFVEAAFISTFFALFITFAMYFRELQNGDLFINRLLYPSQKHPSDESSENILGRIRRYIATLVDR